MMRDCNWNSMESGSCEASWSSWGWWFQGLKGSDVWISEVRWGLEIRTRGKRSTGFNDSPREKQLIMVPECPRMWVAGRKEGRKAQGHTRYSTWVALAVIWVISFLWNFLENRNPKFESMQVELWAGRIAAVSCRWTGRVWEITGWSWKLQ